MQRSRVGGLAMQRGRLWEWVKTGEDVYGLVRYLAERETLRTEARQVARPAHTSLALDTR